MERNFDNVQFGNIRKHLDEEFNKLHDELTECYYEFWKKGLSKPFQKYDVQSTPKESKELFDKLHGLIFEHLKVAFDEFNKETGNGIDKTLYDTSQSIERIGEIKDDKDNVIDEVAVYSPIVKSRVLEAKKHVADLSKQKISLNIDVLAIVQAAKTKKEEDLTL